MLTGYVFQVSYLVSLNPASPFSYATGFIDASKATSEQNTFLPSSVPRLGFA